ncbi:MAG TPA: isocitrate/isopropylmalate dehydrogenase family protein [Myxococcota bacterium]|nr:isocitrate/isopropylmalate dehydrogenase family protein [Myxococcota bacterium]
MTHAITLMYGDGIGPEVVQSAVDIIEASRFKVSWDIKLLGLKALEQENNPLPESTLLSIKKNRIALKGPTTTPVGGGHKSANVLLRKALDLYACIRPVKSIPGLETRYNDVDLVIVRENTEGLYTGAEFELQPGCVVSLRTTTERCCTRIAISAFEIAKLRKKLTAVHKANILKLGDGLFLACAERVAKEYLSVIYEEAIIDALCMRMVIDPTQFDVLLLENMFGDIVSDLCAGLVGGLGLVPGANMGHDIAVFEAVHGSAPDIAGKNVANPTAMIQSALMMLRHMGENDKADAIERALFLVLKEKSLRTRDLGGNLSTREFTKAVIERL